MSIRTLLRLGAVVVLSLTGLFVVASPAQAAMPFFQLPFTCGESWNGSNVYDGNRHTTPWEIDFNHDGGDYGKPVLAAAAGTIVIAEEQTTNGLGNLVKIRHGSSGYYTIYGHLADFAPGLNAGDSVQQGQLIGHVGNSSIYPIGTHLHFEVRYGSDPQPAYFNGVRFGYPTQNGIVSHNCGEPADPVIPEADSSRMRADFTGDGLDDVGLFYDYGGGHVALFVWRGMAGGALATPVRWWDSPIFGSNTRYVSAGDFNGDGKADVALFYQYTDVAGHVALITLTSTGSAFAAPVSRWSQTNWGTGTAFMAAGDFNGDRRTDIALFYDYAEAEAAVFTLLADGSDSDGRGFAAPVDRWHSTAFGSATKFFGAGDFNGDGKSDLALFYDYSDSSAALITFTSTGTGFTTPVQRWYSSLWGNSTAFMSIGRFANGDNKDDIALLYDYGAGHVRLLTFAASTSGTGALGGPVIRWDKTDWGSGTMFMTATRISSTSYDDIQLFYEYSGGPHVAIFSINPGSGAYSTVTRRWEQTNFGSGTQAVF